ncbi:MAG: tRNA (adenosine(37)-N6)-dimethylallyltransferase MiaA [Bacteroidetes bacterium]|nr:MAG: tRNA (adenosine(37)-N6)-dimethylallyltransferase MiaA [Bacteroidota bacterium]
MTAPTARPVVLVIAGPTASGKSALAMALAEAVPVEIVSADSRQVYRRLDIGTAKPTAAERARVPHHAVDIREPDQTFNAGDFVTVARSAIAGITERGRLPILCGGTGLYLRAAVDGFFDQPSFGGEVRKELERRLAAEGKEALYDELRSVDPAAARTMDPSKQRRVIRALEVFRETGVPISRFHAGHRKDDNYTAVWIGLRWERARLYERIERRVDRMMEEGFLDECRGLAASGLDDRLQALQTVGYTEAFRCLRGEMDEREMVRLMKQNTRRFAKRQMTWFRKEERIRWFDVSSEEEAAGLTGKVLPLLR